jgi:DeoR/GlpR family transcriptional regulator of sugar metabolism
MSSKAELRRLQILSELAQVQEVRVPSLSERFGVSEVIIRRDLEYLEHSGRVRRIHGGAVAVPHAFTGQANTGRRPDHVLEKECIGRAAAQFVCPGDRIILDSGTTVLQLARALPSRLSSHDGLTVVTNSLHIVRELGTCHAVDLLLLGGLYLPQFDIVVGPKTVQSLRELRVKHTFVGATGLTLERGISTSNVLEAETDRAAIEAAEEVTLLADSSKIGRDSLTSIVPLTGIHRFVTDANAPSDFLAAVRQLGIEVILAS